MLKRAKGVKNVTVQDMMNVNKDSIATFYSVFPRVQLDISKRERKMLNMPSKYPMELFGRMSHVSPLTSDSPYYNALQYNIKSLKKLTIDGQKVCLTLLDLPNFEVDKNHVCGNKVLFCGMVKESLKMLDFIVYKEIPMTVDMDKYGNELQPSKSQVGDVFVSIPAKNFPVPAFNSNSFWFITYDDKNVYMSQEMQVRSWKSKSKRVFETVDKDFVDDEKFERDVMFVLKQLRDDRSFKLRLGRFLKMDKSSKKIMHDINDGTLLINGTSSASQVSDKLSNEISPVDELNYVDMLNSEAVDDDMLNNEAIGDENVIVTLNSGAIHNSEAINNSGATNNKFESILETYFGGCQDNDDGLIFDQYNNYQ